MRFSVKIILLITLATILTVASIKFFTQEEIESKNIDSISPLSRSHDDLLLDNLPIKDFPRNKEEIKDNLMENNKEIEQNVISSVLYKKHDKDKSYEVWLELLNNGFDNDRSLILLGEFRRLGGGWIYYKELIEKTIEYNLSDKVTELIIKILTDVYEGGEVEQGFTHIPKNEKDQLIQNFLREQLINPKGRLSLVETLRRLDQLESDGNISFFIKESLDTHKNILNEDDIAFFQMRYMNQSFNDFSEIEKTHSKLDGHKKEIFELNIYNTVLETAKKSNGKIIDNNQRARLQDFLNKNKVSFSFDYPKENEGLSIEEWTKNYEENYQKQENSIQKFGLWVESYAATVLSMDSESYVYDYALTTENPMEKIAILNHKFNMNKFNDDYTGFDKYKNSLELKISLEDFLDNDEISENVKDEISFAIQSYFDI